MPRNDAPLKPARLRLGRLLRPVILLPLGSLVFGALPVAAGTKTWTGANDNSLNGGGNWNPNGFPASGDDAVFGSSGETALVGWPAYMGLNSATFTAQSYSLYFS